MFILEFENSHGIRREIAKYEAGDGDPIAIAMKHIRVFCEERKFHIFYTRMWNEPNGETCFDVGSHTEFFYLKRTE